MKVLKPMLLASLSLAFSSIDVSSPFTVGNETVCAVSTDPRENNGYCFETIFGSIHCGKIISIGALRCSDTAEIPN